MSSTVLQFVDQNREHFLTDLKALLRIPSVSTQPDKKPEMLRCAKAEADHCKKIGLENVQLLSTVGYPLVYGDWLHAPGKPTLLIYGHYDVQPADPLDLWKTPAFEPTIKEGNIYCRGSSDNKGQHFSHLCAMEAYLKTVGKLPLNIKVILEGEEECGSQGIIHYLAKRPKLLTCDAVMTSDMPWFDAEHPAVVYGLKGIAYFEVIVEGPKTDLHSGLFGGMIRNPVQALSGMLAQLKDSTERILIPGFYDEVVKSTDEERAEMKKIPFDQIALEKQTGVTLVSESGYTTMETNWTRPTLDICGISGGYEGEGAKTIIPARARAKVSLRLVPNQNPEKMEKLFEDYMKKLCPKECRVTVQSFHSAPALLVDRKHPYLEATAKAYSEGFGKQVIFKREGASIPVTQIFNEAYHVPNILIGLGLPDDNLHAPNEKLSLANFYGGIKGAVLAYQAIADLK